MVYAEQEQEERLSKNTCSVNIKTKEILALDVTDEKVHDCKEMKILVEHVLERNSNYNYKIKTVLADGAYDSNKNFKYLQKKKILPGIKVRKNSIISSKNNKTRNREVKFKLEIPQMEKEKKIWKTMDG